jgi:hypothetical protein
MVAANAHPPPVPSVIHLPSTKPTNEMDELTRISTAGSTERGLVDACDNWVIDEYQSFAQMPNSNEWNRVERSPLDGKIGMSFALQWRYNFSRVFGNQRG